MKPLPHKDPVSNVSLLERSLYFKQLQINRLLEVTQAINNNMKSAPLYKIYKDIMSWEMGIRRMMLLIKNDTRWECVTFSGIDENLTRIDVAELLPGYTRTVNLNEPDHLLLSQFDVVVPVFHKQQALAYAFIGGVNENDDLYEQIRFITTVTNLIVVAIENKRLFKRQLEQERYNRELELAAQVQGMLVPSQLPANERFEMSSVYIPHHGVGGDYYDYIPFGKDRFFFVVADISGKGIAAALLMSNFQANVRALADRPLEPEQFVRMLNKAVLRITNGDRFITMFAALVDLNEKSLVYVNAGHNPPLLWQNGEITKLDKGCTVLGVFPKLQRVEIGKLPLEKGALVVAYTDGLTELRGDNEDFFEESRLETFVRGHAKLDVKSFNDALMRQIEVFKGENDYSDDVSVLTCRVF